MKKSLFHKTLVVLFLVLLVTDSFAQNQKTSDMTNNKNAPQILEMEIHSINEVIKQPKVETESDLKELIGMALFSMNPEKGTNEMQRLIIEVIITAIYKTI